MNTQIKHRNTLKQLVQANFIRYLTFFSLTLFTSQLSIAQSKLDAEIATSKKTVNQLDTNPIATIVYATTAELGALEQNDGNSSFYLMTLANDAKQVYCFSIEFTDFGNEKAALQGLKDELRHYATDTAQIRKLYNYEPITNPLSNYSFLVIWQGAICELHLDKLDQLEKNEQDLYIEKFKAVQNSLITAVPGALWLESDENGTVHWNNPEIRYSLNRH